MQTSEDSHKLANAYKGAYEEGSAYRVWMPCHSSQELDAIVEKLNKLSRTDEEYRALQAGFKDGYLRQPSREWSYTTMPTKPAPQAPQKPAPQKQTAPQKPAPQKGTPQKQRTVYENVVTFVGNLGKPFEHSYTQNAHPISKASLAVWLPGGDNDNTQWFDIAYWYPDGDDFTCEMGVFLDSLNRGDKVRVSGSLTRREYNDRVYYGITIKSIDTANPF